MRIRYPIPFLLLLPALHAQDPRPPDKEWQALSREFLPALEELADWCRVKKLHHEQHELLAFVLALDPDNPHARRVLRYKRDEKGEWAQSPSYHAPRKRSLAKIRPEYEERRDELQAKVLSRSLELLDREKDPPVHELRDRILAALLVLAPDDPEVRRRRGEVRHGERWILAESACALERRAEIAAQAAKILKDVGDPMPASPPAEAAGWGLEWRGCCRTRDLLVAATSGVEEAQRIAGLTTAAGRFFDAVLGVETPFRINQVVYLTATPEERDALIDHHPDCKPDQRDFLRRLASTWPNRGTLAVWYTDPVLRRDAATRQIITIRFTDAFHIDQRRGWVVEGMGLYLSGLVCGTRLSWYVQPSRYVQKKEMSWQRRLQGEANWLIAGKELLDSEEKPSLVNVLRRDVRSLEDRDLLYAFVLAAYVFEGRPGEASKLLGRIADAKDGAAKALEYFGMSAEELEARLRRWLRETLPAKDR